MAKTESVSDRFHMIDLAFTEQLGQKKVERIVEDTHNQKLSLRQVADRNGVNMSDVVQIARFYKFDPVTLERTK